MMKTFLWMIGAKVRKLPEEVQSDLRFDIYKIVHDAEKNLTTENEL